MLNRRGAAAAQIVDQLVRDAGFQIETSPLSISSSHAKPMLGMAKAETVQGSTIEIVSLTRWQRPPACRCFSRGRIFQKRTCRQRWPIFEQRTNLTRSLPLQNFCRGNRIGRFGRRAAAGILRAVGPAQRLDHAHIGGGAGRQQCRRMTELIRSNARRYLSGEPLKRVVRTPDGTLQGF
jgi:hypothetical protein